MKNYFRLRAWGVLCLGLHGLAGSAWAATPTYSVSQEKRPVAVNALPGAEASIKDAQGNLKPLSNGKGFYVALTHNPPMPPGANGNTLLVCLPGSGEGASNFATVWMGLMRSHPNLVVAVPDIDQTAYSSINNTSDMVNAIIADTKARDQVNPKHIILAGYSQGADEALIIVRNRPEMFAGLAVISVSYFDQLLTPYIQSYAGKLALYINEGSSEVSVRGAAFDTAALHYFGFSHVLEERRDGGHIIVVNTFEPETKHMMAFFDDALAANDTKAAAVVESPAPAITPAKAAEIVPPANVVVEERTVTPLPSPRARGPAPNRAPPTTPNRNSGPPPEVLARMKQNQPQQKYVFLAPDRTKVPALHDATLLICLHGPGDTGSDFAKNWLDLVGSRADVVVAVPNSGVANLNAIEAIIKDTVARDQVNPRHVILVGHDLGGDAAGRMIGAKPDLFAGFAGLSTNLPEEMFTPAWQQAARRMAVYYAAGKQDEMFKAVYADNIAEFKKAGFTNFLAEAPDAGHALAPVEIQHLMAFFDQALTAQDKTQQQRTNDR